VQDALITTKPHSLTDRAEVNYRDFSGRAVTTGYIAQKATEAGLAP
jgi:hypothetical protein